MKTKLNIKRKATIDDGMNPELVRGADFDGYNGIPIIKKPTEIIIPNSIVPFSKISKADTFEDAIATYEMDQEFSDLLIRPDEYVDVLKKHIFISLEALWHSPLAFEEHERRGNYCGGHVATP